MPNAWIGPVCAPENVVNCEPEIHLATPTSFELRNKKKAQNFIIGELVGGGELEFWIENRPQDQTGCPGWWMFNQLMEHFRGRVTLLTGYWIRGDNLDEVNRLTTAGTMTLEDAAKLTKTGGYARSWGFATVEIVYPSPGRPKGTLGTPGNYHRVHVKFKP